MPTRRLPDPPQEDSAWSLLLHPPCFHPEHSPPALMVYQPGTYEHTCPACGKVQMFHVPRRSFR